MKAKANTAINVATAMTAITAVCVGNWLVSCCDVGVGEGEFVGSGDCEGTGVGVVLAVGVGVGVEEFVDERLSEDTEITWFAVTLLKV